MAENTLQFEWIVTIKEAWRSCFPGPAAMCSLPGISSGIPSKGHPKIRTAPDAMVAFGRPKGYRGSYMQWEEGGIAPQVVFEILHRAIGPGKMITEVQVLRAFRCRGILHLRS